MNLGLDLRIDESYVPDMNQRLAAYRRLASARTLDEVEGFVDELRDRFGAGAISRGATACFSSCVDTSAAPASTVRNVTAGGRAME